MSALTGLNETILMSPLDVTLIGFAIISSPDSNLILLERGNKLNVIANKKTEFIFVAGKPIGEPIARGGPFVMNTKAEILEAIQDYNNGTFAKY